MCQTRESYAHRAASVARSSPRTSRVRQDGGVADSRSERGLFSAVVAVAAGLELTSTLRRIVQAAVDLSDARYGALGVIGPRGGVVDFIHVGMDDQTVASIGDPPSGRGVLGLLVEHPVPLRVDDLGTHPASSGFPANHPPMHSFLGVPVRVRGRVFGNLYLTEKRNGARFTAEDEYAVTALAAAAAVAIENARLFERTRQRSRWQRAVTEVDNLVLAGAPETDVLALIARQARALAGADLSAIALPVDDEGLEFAIRLVDADQPGPVSLIGRTCTMESTSCLDGVAMRFPMRSADRVLALLLLSWNDAGAVVDAETREMAEDFATQAAVTLVLSEVRQEQQRLAVYEDRDRIARDLHDLVIQRLFATGMLLQGTTRIDGVPPKAADRLSRAVDELDETIREIRQTIFALHEPVESHSDTLRGRVLRESAQSGALLGFSPSVRFVGPVDSLADRESIEHIVAVLREALTNAAKHAQAAKVEVLVQAGGGSLVLVVTDDGVGIEESGRRSGLANLVARAHDVDGSCVVERVSPEGGTRVTWRMPT